MTGGQRHNPKKQHKFSGLFKASIATTTQKYRRLFSAPMGSTTKNKGYCTGANLCSKFPTLVSHDRKATELGRTTGNFEGHKWEVLVGMRDHWRVFNFLPSSSVWVSQGFDSETLISQVKPPALALSEVPVKASNFSWATDSYLCVPPARKEQDRIQ